MLVAQISDSHISLDHPARLADLERCVDQVNALDPKPEIAVHTGDIVHDGLPAQYAAARQVLDRLQMPYFVLPGNRDKRPALIDAFADRVALRPDATFVQYAVDRFPVRLLCLDTLSTSSNCESRRQTGQQNRSDDLTVAE